MRLSHQLIELDSFLQHFYAEVKKQNGDDYEPIIYYAVCRQGLTDRKAQKYKHSRKGKTKSVEGKRPNKASSLTHAEEETLWSCGQFGSSTPASLINTIWWQFTQHFGLRGRQEPMKVQDFSLK